MSPRIEPEEQDFDPDEFGGEELLAAYREGLELFDAGEYHAAHEAFERCWLSMEGGDADFFKGLVQASICMHHARRENLEGARKLYSGHRRLLGPYSPEHRGLDVAAFLTEMQRAMRPVLRARGEERVPFDADARPRVGRAGPGVG